MTYTDRTGKEIAHSHWFYLHNLRGYRVVRQYRRAGSGVQASIEWNGQGESPFTLNRSNMPMVVCKDALSAISQYEDFLASKGCGEWFPINSVTDKYGKQVSAGFAFHAIGNECKDEELIPDAVSEAVANNDLFGTW